MCHSQIHAPGKSCCNLRERPEKVVSLVMTYDATPLQDEADISKELLPKKNLIYKKKKILYFTFQATEQGKYCSNISTDI